MSFVVFRGRQISKDSWPKNERPFLQACGKQTREKLITRSLCTNEIHFRKLQMARIKLILNSIWYIEIVTNISAVPLSYNILAQE